MRKAIVASSSILIDCEDRDLYKIDIEISLNGQAYDYQNKTYQENIDQLNDAQNIFTTSQPNPFHVEQLLTKLDSQYDLIYIVVPNRKFSGAYSTISKLIKNPGKFLLIEAHCITVDETLIVKYILENNPSYPQIIDHLKRIESFVIVKDFRQLKKSGRLLAVTTFALTTLNINLAIYTNSSNKVMKLSSRGEKAFFYKLQKHLAEHRISDMLYVSAEQKTDYNNKIVNLLKETTDNIQVYPEIPFPIVTHFGENTYAFSYVRAN